jgi:hypothetical protein
MLLAFHKNLRIHDQSHRISANVKSINLYNSLEKLTHKHPPVHVCIHTNVLPVTPWFSWYILSCMRVYSRTHMCAYAKKVCIHAKSLT